MFAAPTSSAWYVVQALVHIHRDREMDKLYGCGNILLRLSGKRNLPIGPVLLSAWLHASGGPLPPGWIACGVADDRRCLCRGVLRGQRALQCVDWPVRVLSAVCGKRGRVCVCWMPGWILPPRPFAPHHPLFLKITRTNSYTRTHSYDHHTHPCNFSTPAYVPTIAGGYVPRKRVLPERPLFLPSRISSIR